MWHRMYNSYILGLYGRFGVIVVRMRRTMDGKLIGGTHSRFPWPSRAHLAYREIFPCQAKLFVRALER